MPLVLADIPVFDHAAIYSLGDRVLYDGDILILGPEGFYREKDNMLINFKKEVSMPCGGKKTGGKKPPKK